MVWEILGINANIMSLGGLALAISVMVDSSVVLLRAVAAPKFAPVHAVVGGEE